MAGWLERLRYERGYSERTLTSYRQALSSLAGLAGAHDMAATQPADIRRWVGQLAQGGLSARSIAHRLSVWRGFFDEAGANGSRRPDPHESAPSATGTANPARGVRAPRAGRRLPKALSPDDAMRLVGYQPRDTFEQHRDKAIVELLYSSGLRLAELCSLDAQFTQSGDTTSVSWLDMSEAQVTVTGKGRKSRSVPVGRDALQALRAWLSVRADWLRDRPGADARALFLSRRGARLSHRSVQARMRELGVGQGIASAVHPHVLRHSFASHVLQSSGDLRAVQELLGHASIATTQVYTSLDFQRLAQVYDAAHPRARLGAGPDAPRNAPRNAPRLSRPRKPD